MSDFLRNLVARNFGTADVVSPRVPSLYEPYKRDANSLPIETETISAQREPAGREEPLLAGEREARPAARRAVNPPRNRFARSDEFSPRPAPLSNPAGFAAETPAANGRPLASAPIVQRQAAQAELPDSHSTTVSPLSPASRIARLARSGTASQPLNFAQAQSDATSAAASPAQPPGIESHEFATNGLVHEPVARRSTPSAPVRPPVIPRAASDPDFHDLASSGHNLSGIFPGIPVADSPIAPGRFPAGVPTPPAAARPSAQFRSASQASPAAPEAPPVRVTIGKVEVRAIFPDAAPRRAPVQGPRPTVSLDDYLKRGGEAKR